MAGYRLEEALTNGNHCRCACHANTYAGCDQPGGCGTSHRACPTCALYRPDSAPRLPNRPPICDGDRTLLDRHLVEIGNLHADLVNDEEPIRDDRQHERFGTAYFEGNIRHVFSKGMYPSDPVATLGGVAPINSRSRQPSVSGSRERPLPVNAAALDLKAPAKVPNPTAVGAAHPDDQIGHLSTATILDSWIRDIRATLYPDQHLPAARVDELVLWLRNRLDDICDHHPRLIEMATDVRNLRGALRAATGQTETRPEPCTAIPCRRCDLATLFRQPGGTVECANPDCQAILHADEYREWVSTLLKEKQINGHAAA